MTKWRRWMRQQFTLQPTLYARWRAVCAQPVILRNGDVRAPQLRIVYPHPSPGAPFRLVRS